MKKIASILLSIIVIATVAAPMVAFGGMVYYDDEAEILQAGYYSQKDFSLDDLDTSIDNYTEMQKYIYEQLLSYSSTLTFDKYNITDKELNLAYTVVIDEHPELFYVSSSYQYNRFTSTGYVHNLLPLYAISKSEIPEAKKIFEKGVNKALAQVDDSMTDVQKALTIHDYLCNIATYPDLSATGDLNIYHSAYGIFYDGNTVCAGYTLAYSAIMKLLGIESEYVVSDAMMHSWNVIKIDGKWYNVDLTFDEINFQKGTNNVGCCEHYAFLKSTQGIMSSLGLWHYDIYYPKGIVCDDTTYDDYFWNGVNTNIYVVDKDYYYLKLDPDARRSYLIKRDLEGNESQILDKNIFTYISTFVNSSPDKSESFNAYFPFTKLSYDSGWLYFTENSTAGYSTVYAVNPRNLKLGYYVIDKHDSHTFGFGFVNGEISYSTYADRYNYNNISRIDFFDEYYQARGKRYNPYPDCNNDGFINAKDYAYIISRN